MIPLTLKIQGIFSYQDEAVIDFSKLAQANIFGIFGKVGSGKSTILEAIMFALYGEVARMGSSGRSYNMMNLRSNQMKVDFTFDVGGVMYRALVETNRKKKNFDQVDTPSFRYFSWINEDWQPFADFNAAKVLGIEAQHFKKTIIIPQNEFQKFLELSPTERTRMIKDIFINLEKFELEENAKSLENQNKAQILMVENQLREIGDITADVIEGKKVQLIDIQKKKDNNQEKLKAEQAQEKALQELKSKFEELEKLNKQAEKLAHTEGGVLTLQKQIVDYEYFLEYLKTPLEQQASLSKNIEKNKQDLAHTQKQLAENEVETQKIQHRLEELTPLFNDRESLLKKRDEIGWLIEIKSLHEKIELNKLNTQTGISILTEKEEKRQNILNEKAPFTQERDYLLKNQPDFQKLQAVNNWFSTALVLKRDITGFEKKMDDILNTLKKLDEKRKHISQFLFAEYKVQLPYNVTISEIILSAKALKKDMDAQKQHIENQLIQLRATEQLEALSNALSEGTPCPLCGAEHHPAIWNAQDIQKHITDAERQLERYRNDVSTVQNIENELITLLQNYNNQKDQQADWLKKVEAERRNLAQHEANFIWADFNKHHFEAFKKTFDESALFGEKLKKVQIRLDDLEKNLSETNEYIDRCKKRLTDLTTELSVLSANLGNSQSRIVFLTEDAWLATESEVLIEQAQLFENQYRTISENYTTCEKKLKELTEKGQILRGGVEEKIKANNTLSEDFESLSLRLRNLLEASPFSDLAAIAAFINQGFDLIKSRHIVADFKRQQSEITGQINHLSVQLKDKTYNPENHQALQTDIQTLTDFINAQIKQLTLLEAEIKNLAEKLDRRKALETEHLKLETRGKNLELLRSMFSRSGFVNYVSTKYLVNLCKSANERFLRFTRGQLRLKVTDSNDFEIEDLFNFGKTRHIKTLSGGQIFQASLALALALADSIQALSKTEQNFFFLDEGFGSLDRDSMQEVFNTLKSLRKENRIVGVISHVEEMQQEIGRYLKVTFDSERGSQVEIV